MADFGDDDPRDAWDDNDSPEQREKTLLRIVNILEPGDYELKAWISKKREELDG